LSSLNTGKTQNQKRSVFFHKDGLLAVTSGSIRYFHLNKIVQQIVDQNVPADQPHNTGIQIPDFRVGKKVQVS
jgi:hypothetical protein